MNETMSVPLEPGVTRLGAVAVGLSAVVAVAAMLVADAITPAVSWRVAFTSAGASALAGVLVARRAAAPDDRRRWSWWAAAASAWVAGQVAWDAYALTGSPAFERAGHGGFYLFAVIAIGGLLRSAEPTRAVRAVAAMEVVPLIAAAMSLTAGWLWEDASASTLPVVDRVIALLYPAVYVSAAVVTLQAIVGSSLRRISGRGARLVLAGI